MTHTILFLHSVGDQPDRWTEVINHLPAHVTPLLANVTGPEGLGNVEKLLDKHEARQVDVVADGTGAVTALQLVGNGRVDKLVLLNPTLGLDRIRQVLAWTPKFLLRRRGIDKDEAMATLAEVPKFSNPTLVLGGNADFVPDHADVRDLPDHASGLVAVALEFFDS